MKNQYQLHVVFILLAGITLTVVGACVDEEPAGGEATEVRVTADPRCN